jgi:serine/threonine protein kinase/tetratricopeptide (TPR) repeat protein
VIVPDSERWKRISPLLDGLLDLAPGPREERLASLRAHDPGLADELASLIADAARAEAAQFLVGSALPPAPTATGATAGLAGTTLGAYVLEAEIGQGGMGTVWKARRADGRFEGSVAVKLLHLSLVGRTGSRRFEREGAILARLAHPHIARMLDAGLTPGGQPYLVLELVEGERIDVHCDARQLSVEQRIALFREVLDAVAHAHRHLVIHRDIKPSNILVTADGGVKLLDFGIAKLLQGDADDPPTDLTGAHRGALTPDYAAPEQLLGQDVTTATDVYSLGVLLYQLLSGQHPTAPAHASAAELMRTTLDTDPGRLSAALTASHGVPISAASRVAAERHTSVLRLKRQLGGDLENIVAKALRKAPGERYLTVDAFSDDLRRWAASEPVSARPDSFAYRTARFVRRHRGKVAASALTIVAIVAGLVGTISQARRAEQQARLARIERDHALHDLAFAGSAHELLSFLVSQGNGKSLTASQLLERAVQMADQQYTDDAMTRGRLQLILAVEYGNLLEFDKSKAVLTQAQASARSASDVELLSNVDCLLAATMGDQNEPQRALALFDEAIRRLDPDSVNDDSVRASCLHMRADLHGQLGQPEGMLADAQAALAALGSPRADQRVLANSIRVTLAEAHGRLGQIAPALAAYEASLADLQSMGHQQTARTVIRFNNFSRMLYVAGQAKRAEEMAARGLQISNDSGAANEIDAILEGNRARALIELGRYDEARVLSEHALASALQRNDTRWAGTFALYGAPAACAVGDVARCASLLAIARDKLKATLPPGHSTFGAIELAAAQLSLAQGDAAAARVQLARAVAIFDAAKDKSPLRVRALGELARSEQQSGDAAAATRDAAAAVIQARAAAPGLSGTAWLGNALLVQAVVQRAQGDPTVAQGTLREALEQLQASLGDGAPSTREARTLLAGS